MKDEDNVTERLDAAVRSLDPRASVVLAYHAAIERELDLAIARRLPNPQLLRGLGFGQKVGLWAATGDKDPIEIEAEARLLVAFNDLRNAIAHGDKRAAVDRHLKVLLENSGWVEALSSEDAVHHAAGWLFGIVNEVE